MSLMTEMLQHPFTAVMFQSVCGAQLMKWNLALDLAGLANSWL